MKSKNLFKLFNILLVFVFILSACSGGGNKTSDNSNNSNENTDNSDKPATWIADREIEGIVFQSASDAGADIPENILAEIKKRTGITLKITTVDADSSLQALTAGLASGDLPDFISFYLNHSGRPEMQILLKGAREGQFVDLAPFMKDAETYSKYLDEDYLPIDTRDNITFRDEFDGAAYLMHMSISRNSGTEAVTTKYVGGPYIRADIAEDLGFKTGDVKTSEDLYELAKKIQAGNYKDDNDKAIYAIGPTVWGGNDRDYIYKDLVWSGVSSEKFLRDEADGKIKHESQTDWGIKRVEYVQNLMAEKIMHPEFYTMEETRAAEGVVNGSFGIVADLHNYDVNNKNMKYIPLGNLNEVTGDEYRMTVPFKSGYAGWAIPSTTKNPEEVFKFADFLASKEGKMLYLYGIEGEHYDLDDNGNPIPKKEIVDLKENDYAEATKLGFRGVGAYWGEHLGWTDLDNLADFGELSWGDSVKGDEDGDNPEKIRQLFGYDEFLKNAAVVDGMTPQSFLFEFDPNGDLDTALKDYDEDLQRAFYSKSLADAEKIMNDSYKKLERAGLLEYVELLEAKDKEESTKLKMNVPQE